MNNDTPEWVHVAAVKVVDHLRATSIQGPEIDFRAVADIIADEFHTFQDDAYDIWLADYDINNDTLVPAGARAPRTMIED